MNEKNNDKLPAIKLNMVRLSYPSLFQVKVWEESKPGKYEATFILNKDKHKKEIDIINSQIDTYFEKLKWVRSKIKPDHICLKDGDLTDRDEYQNSYTIKGTSINRFPIVNKDGVTPISEKDDIFYAGCYVNAYIDLWTYSKPTNGIACNLKAIQFAADGEHFGGSKFDISGMFDSIESEESFF